MKYDKKQKLFSSVEQAILTVIVQILLPSLFFQWQHIMEQDLWISILEDCFTWQQ